MVVSMGDRIKLIQISLDWREFPAHGHGFDAANAWLLQ
jgi:hypothetical protein